MPPQARHTLVLELQVRENVGRTRAAMRDLAADTDRAARSVDDLGRRMDRAADRAERLAGGGRAVREMESREARRAGVYGFADERPTGGTAGAYGLLPAERVRGRPTALSTAERHAIDRRAADEQVRRRLEFQEPPGERLRPGQANQIIRDAALLRAGGAASEGAACSAASAGSPARSRGCSRPPRSPSSRRSGRRPTRTRGCTATSGSG
jgi:hypothetical protein